MVLLKWLNLVFLIFSQVNKGLVEKKSAHTRYSIKRKELFSNRTVMRINKSDGLPVMFGLFLLTCVISLKACQGNLKSKVRLNTCSIFNTKDLFNNSEWICHLGKILPMLPSFFRHWDQWWLLSFAKPTWVNMCMINGAIIVHGETINVLLHTVGCPLTRPTSNASQKSCTSVCPGFRWGTKGNILIVYSGTNLKVVFFFFSFFPSSQQAMNSALNSGVRQLSSSVPLVNHAPCFALWERAGCLRRSALFSTLSTFIYSMNSTS